MDCSELVALAFFRNLYRTVEMGKNPKFQKVDTPQPGDVKVWIAQKGGEPNNHMAIITGLEGDRAILHSDDENGVRFSTDYFERFYTIEGYTFSIEYYRPIW